MRPCRSVCRNVEQKCPFFLPGDRAPAYPTQYAGEPTFLCLGKCLADPNIPESGEQLVKSSYGEDDCCYEHCTQDKLPTLCARNTSCPPSEKTPPAVVCEPPPPAPTPAPGERTLPSACAASIAAPPPPPPPRSAGAVPMTDRCLLGLIGVLILHRLAVHAARVRVSSPARGPVALEAGAAAGAGDAAPSNRPRPHPWPRPRLRPPNWIRLRRRHHHRPFGPLRPSRMPTGAPLLQLLRRELLRTNRLGKRTTATVILSLFRFVEHIT
ncbi:hypothetical protein ONE63_006850 [Megalurothrips usitatus]|uniref:Uncharacterized protein n=1 Tax=Megalurothrips usitatus TaxID=439358 RepID=A0AAV7XR89_9NEOP|nr:hypothetical protein ONE63_006850 [Megalurothrips usitatus]